MIASTQTHRSMITTSQGGAAQSASVSVFVMDHDGTDALSSNGGSNRVRKAYL